MFEWFCHYEWEDYQAQYVGYVRPDGQCFFWMVPNSQGKELERY